MINPPRSARTRDTLALFDPAFGTGQFRPAFLGLTVPWTQLPATVDQRVAADPFMQRSPGQHHPLTREAATEEAFSETYRSPAKLLIATHGYLALAEQPREANNNLAQIEQPLRYCGIVLAGANQRLSGKSDNYLTGEEISNLPLDGCHAFCVVCVGGLGLNQDSQGVASINQAFQLAGTRTLVTTLWEIQQQAGTVPLMQAYWSERARDAIPEEALRTTKLAVLAEERTAHPYFWAAFTLSGSSRVLSAVRDRE